VQDFNEMMKICEQGCVYYESICFLSKKSGKIRSHPSDFYQRAWTRDKSKPAQSTPM